jgi:hypothetical protein
LPEHACGSGVGRWHQRYAAPASTSKSIRKQH